MKIIIVQITLMTPLHTHVGSTTTEVLENLSGITKRLFTWFANNQMKGSDDKCHLLLSSADDSPLIQIENSTIKCSKVKKLLGVHIDYKLKFDIHVETICGKAHSKLRALLRITNYMELPKRFILMNACLKLSLTTVLLFGCFTVAV